jgi:hypothetical protein
MSVEEDVATVLALLPVVRKYREAIKDAMPPAARLEGAGYPGAEMVVGELSCSIEDEGLTMPSGAPGLLLRFLQLMESGAGKQSTYDFEWFANYLGLSVENAATEMVDVLGTDEESLDRIKAMRQYAATVA